MNLIFIVETPFMQRDEDRYGILYLMQNGINVKVFDLTLFLRPHLRDLKIEYTIERSYIYKVETYEVFNELSNQIDSSDYILYFLGYNQLILEMVLRNKPTIVYTYTNTIPFYFKKISFWYSLSLLYFFCQIKDEKLLFHPLKFINKFIEALAGRLRSKVEKSNEPNFYNKYLVIAGGLNSVDNRYPIEINNDQKKIWCHTLDYDIYLNLIRASFSKEIIINDIYQKSYKLKTFEYILFLDEYLPFHPDYKIQNIPPDETAQNYYKSLCIFFEEIEKKFKKEIIIAAHPRSNYQDRPNYFGNRKVFLNNTGILVKNSELVLMHASTSINFVNLFKKKVIFFCTYNMSCRMKRYVKILANWHDTGVVQLDRNGYPIDQKFINNIASGKAFINYLDYRESYIKKTGSPEKYSWEILLDKIKSSY